MDSTNITVNNTTTTTVGTTTSTTTSTTPAPNGANTHMIIGVCIGGLSFIIIIAIIIFAITKWRRGKNNRPPFILPNPYPENYFTRESTDDGMDNPAVSNVANEISSSVSHHASDEQTDYCNIAAERTTQPEYVNPDSFSATTLNPELFLIESERLRIDSGEYLRPCVQPTPVSPEIKIIWKSTPPKIHRDPSMENEDEKEPYMDMTRSQKAQIKKKTDPPPVCKPGTTRLRYVNLPDGVQPQFQGRIDSSDNSTNNTDEYFNVDCLSKMTPPEAKDHTTRKFSNRSASDKRDPLVEGSSDDNTADSSQNSINYINLNEINSDSDCSLNMNGHQTEQHQDSDASKSNDFENLPSYINMAKLSSKVEIKLAQDKNTKHLLHSKSDASVMAPILKVPPKPLPKPELINGGKTPINSDTIGITNDRQVLGNVPPKKIFPPKNFEKPLLHSRSVPNMFPSTQSNEVTSTLATLEEDQSIYENAEELRSSSQKSENDHHVNLTQASATNLKKWSPNFGSLPVRSHENPKKSRQIVAIDLEELKAKQAQRKNSHQQL